MGKVPGECPAEGVNPGGMGFKSVTHSTIAAQWPPSPIKGEDLCTYKAPTRSSSPINRVRASGNCLSTGQSTRRSRK